MSIAPVRVLLIDDSVVVRRIVSDALARDARLEIVGTAANGRLGLAKIERLRPEVVILDVEMPVLDGIGTLEELRRTRRAPKVVMFSTLTDRGAAVTLEALSLGAADYVTKPSNAGGLAEAQARVREEMIPKILALVPRFAIRTRGVAPSSPSAPVQSVRGSFRPPPRRSVRPVRRVAPPSRIDLLVIGASTGGPNALNAVIPHLPSPIPVPVMVVQHMPPMFTRLLAERLDKLCPFPVSEAADGMVLEPNHVYIAPGGLHMAVASTGLLRRGHMVRVHDGPTEHSCRPAVDVLFRSAVKAFGEATMGVILTGMGKDGLAGCELIRSAGGQVVSQDEETSVVFGMPGWVARMGATDAVLPLDDIASEVARRLRLGRALTRLRTGTSDR